MKKEKTSRNKRKTSKPKSRTSKLQTPNSELRKRAELRLRGKDGDLKDLSPRESEELIHELQIHQIELEMQNKDQMIASFTAPKVDKVKTMHFILEVTDDGIPSLTRYERVIVNVIP